MAVREMIRAFSSGREMRDIVTNLRLQEIDPYSPQGRKTQEVQRFYNLRHQESTLSLTAYAASFAGQWLLGNPVTSGRNDSYLNDYGLSQNSLGIDFFY